MDNLLYRVGKKPFNSAWNGDSNNRQVSLQI